MSVTRRNFLGAAAAAPLIAQRGGAPQRPNVLVILADDLAAWMLGCYGNQEIRTPNIDQFARSGVRFFNSFVSTPICSASRATFFTGRVPRQHGIHDFLTDRPEENPPQGQKAAPPSFANEVMISDLLAQAGYNCGYVGKWHMGNDTKPGHGYSYTYTMHGGSRSYTDPEMYLNGERVKESGYLTDHMTRRAMEFLDQQSAAKPFFLTVGYLNPHTPYEGHPQKYYDLYAKATFDKAGWEKPAPNALREKGMLADIVGNLRRAAASVTALDDQIPLLMKKLQDRKLWENTLVIFTGDNGYLLGRHGLWSKGHASNPINMYDESVQVPMIWSWPGRIPVEGVRPEMISFYDVMPTLCEATGVTPPARNLCGKSFLTPVRGLPLPKKQVWPTTVFAHFRNTEMARDTRYKLVLRNDGEGPNEIFDLKADPRERVNQYDNPAYVSVRDRLRKQLDEWRAKTSS
ncbi:MAG: sulfatase-like hydrolase/transferase [Bryobacteraceae bacterium]|nr:sulfatase-like hydrolase/transferase [Bryobacteraceae bacterium]